MSAIRLATFLSCATTAFIIGAVTTPVAIAQNETVVEQQMITPNYKDVDIRQIVETVSELTGRNFLLDARVKGSVTMISETPMTMDAFYETFLSILQVYGFVAIPSGNTIKIIPDTNVRNVSSSDPLRTSGRASGDEIVTEVIQVNNVGAAQLVPSLRPLVPQYGHLAAHPASNMLIISDRAANVKRLKNIIRRIDQSGDEDIEVIPLEHALAGEIVRILTTMSQASARGADAATSTPVVLSADERTNSVLISGDKTARLRYRTLIAHLDTPLPDGGNTQVVYLRYANAEELATKLTEQARGGAQGGQGTAPTSAPQNNVTIWADAGTNALVITAPPKIMRSLRQVIDKIDIRRAQVHVEAVLVEVTADKSAELGITWALDGTNDVAGAGLTNFPNSTSSVLSIGGALAAGDGNITGIPALSNGLTFGIGRISENGTSIAAIANFFAGDGNTNILSTPSVTTMDNEEAEIRVGQEVPFLTGSFSNTGGGNTGAVNPFQTIQRRDVGILLKITPQINEGDAVILDLELEASSLSQGAESNLDLVTNQRNIKQKVVVEDGGIIVLGGLIDDNLLENDQRVPVLSAIPVVGNLFRSRRTTKVKRNLMVFIRPKILRDGVQASLQTNAKYNYIRDLQIGQTDDVALIPSSSRPALPPLEDALERGIQQSPPPVDGPQ
ncbi:MAG: type II secretion system secretin GspD [Pseudomonadota bacterium]